MTEKQENKKYNLYEEGKKANLTLTYIIAILLSIFTGLAGFYIGDRKAYPKTNESGQNVVIPDDEEIDKLFTDENYDLELYKKIVALLKENYIDESKIDEKELFYGSLRGMVDSIGDPATNYFSPEDYEEYKKSEFEGSFKGIGVRLEYRESLVSIEQVFEGSPAEESGVEVGWFLVEVNGKDVTKDTIEEIVNKVRGEENTVVKIGFFNPRDGEKVEKEITRREVQVESMRLIEVNNDTVIFEISRFLEPTPEQWRSKWDQKVSEINSKGYKNIILDLRNNGGGYLDAAIYASNDILDAGSLVMKEKTRTREKETKTTNKSPRLKDKKIVVLVNGNTASASEILAGALNYNKGIKIIGSKTYGKGTVQSPIELDEGGALKVTTEYWLLPSGQRLDKDTPITPDIEISFDEEAYKEGRDVYVEEALKQL